MSPRAIVVFAISLLDEAIFVALLLWGLPRLGVRIPLPWQIIILVMLLAYGIFTYRLIARALAKRCLVGQTDMVGCRGKVIVPLAPEGSVKIGGELWRAESAEGRIEAGADVVVLAQDRLKLTVRQNKGGS